MMEEHQSQEGGNDIKDPLDDGHEPDCLCYLRLSLLVVFFLKKLTNDKSSLKYNTTSTQPRSQV